MNPGGVAETRLGVPLHVAAGQKRDRDGDEQYDDSPPFTAGEMP